LSEGVVEFIEELSSADINYNCKSSVGIKTLLSKLWQERRRKVVNDVPPEVFKGMSDS
jgi:hypothetical protein